MKRLYVICLVLVLFVGVWVCGPVNAQDTGKVLVNGVSIELDQTLTPSWNEIDAVELVGYTVSGDLLRQWAVAAEASSQYGDDGWSAMQATGAPDTFACGDFTTAWASALSDGQDVLTLIYEIPVYPVEVNIYQTYNPGAIIAVNLLPLDDSSPFLLFAGTDPATACPEVLSISAPSGEAQAKSIGLEILAAGIQIDLDQTLTGSWNEIDAVEMVGLTETGELLRQWATAAIATSQYGDEGWSAMQATGAPDTEGCGDFTTAWASAQSDGQDSLTLYYDVPVFPLAINIYQTYNLGAITQVSVLPFKNDPPVISVFSGVDLTIMCPGVLQISLTNTLVE